MYPADSAVWAVSVLMECMSMHGGCSAVLWTMVPHYMRLFLIHSINSEFSKCKCIISINSSSCRILHDESELVQVSSQFFETCGHHGQPSNYRKLPYSKTLYCIHLLLRQTVNSSRVSVLIS